MPFFQTRHSIIHPEIKITENGDLIFGSFDIKSHGSIEVEGFVQVDKNQVLLLNDSFNRLGSEQQN